ncbi:MAG TPA: UDP-glucuronic acid decarboxylase family protein [Streptosporangiaceae bacterium]
MGWNGTRSRSRTELSAPKRILITGGSGFIGSHLSKTLLSLGHDVLVVDNFYSSSRHNVLELLGEPGFELMRHDVTFPLYVEVDQIYHLACPASPVFYQRDPVQTTKTCVHGSINMLGLAKRLRVPILLASTSEVYGDPAVHPQAEAYWGNVNPIGIRSCYDEGKRCAETLFFDYHRQHGLPVKVARIFNTYGPNMLPNDGRVVSSFVVQALRGEPVTIFGDGSQTRSFCYVDDMVRGLIGLMNSAEEVTGPVNLGNPCEYTMIDLAKKVLTLAGSDSPVEHRPLPSDDPVRRRPDISRARELLGWEPSVPLDDGLERTVAYFRSRVCGSSDLAASIRTPRTPVAAHQ